MAEYIDRDALRKLMYEEAFEKDSDMQRWDSGCWIRYKLFENCIEAIPAADVKPVIRAHWYVDNGCAYCSNCRNNFKKAILKEAKYCPKCGAQIDGYGGHPDAGPPTPYDLLYEEGGPDA